MGLQMIVPRHPRGFGVGFKGTEMLRRVENPSGIHPDHQLGERLGWKMAFLVPGCSLSSTGAGCSRILL